MTGQWKLNQVKQICEKVKSHPVVGVVRMRKLPTSQLQKIREAIPAELFMAKKSTLVKGLEAAHLNKLIEYVNDQPALLVTKENPFRLYSLLKKSRVAAPAKAGDLSPRDISVEKGDTSFPAGPILGELKAAGIPCAIEKGRIAITESKVIVRKGEKINAKLAPMLVKLGIQPMELGLELVAALEKGEVYPASVLAIDEQAYLDNITKAFRHSFNLSVEAAYPTKANTELLVQKAFRSSKSLAIEAGIANKATVGDLMAKARVQALGLKAVSG